MLLVLVDDNNTGPDAIMTICQAFHCHTHFFYLLLFSHTGNINKIYDFFKGFVSKYGSVSNYMNVIF